MKSLSGRPTSLSVQLIVGFVLLALITATVTGLSGIWLINRQLQAQAWALVDQGSRAARALYAARQRALMDLATLTAERPSLRGLLRNGDDEGLADYLKTLEAGAGVELMLVCDPAGQPLTQASTPPALTTHATILCRVDFPEAEVIVLGDPRESTKVWMLASKDIVDDGQALGRVVVGIELDQRFALAMESQTGLDHAIVVDGNIVASTFSAPISLSQLIHYDTADGMPREALSVGGRPYYGSYFSLNPRLSRQLEAKVALAIEDLVAAQRRLVGLLVGSMLLAAVLGTTVATFLTRRIGRPLAELADAATALSDGDLTASLAVETRVREVALVGHALEGARVDLRRTLDELRREKAWTDHLLDAIVEGIVALDRQGQVTFFSSGAERITGWSRDEVVGQLCDGVFAPLGTDQPFSKLIPDPGSRTKIPMEVQGGRQVILSMSAARLLSPESGDARVALVFRDISEEEAIHRMLSHFLANIAHEFRTPLSAVAASVELLMDQAPDLSPGELQELLTSLHLGVLNLQKLVDNLLEAASIEAGRFQVYPHPTDLGKIISEAVQTMQPLLDKHGQHLTVTLPASVPVLDADLRRTVQVLVNLLSNASKYGPAGGEIDIVCAEQDGWVRISVADRGPGIPPVHRRDLFRRFVPLDGGEDSVQMGFGLGLSVVKAIVEAHGGSVGVDSRPGGGSVFWFTLPAIPG